MGKATEDKQEGEMTEGELAGGGAGGRAGDGGKDGSSRTRVEAWRLRDGG